MVTSVNVCVRVSYEALPVSFTCIALQRHTLAYSELVSRAAAQAATGSRAEDAVLRTRLTLSPHRVEKPLWTDVPTLTLKEVPGHPEFI